MSRPSIFAARAGIVVGISIWAQALDAQGLATKRNFAAEIQAELQAVVRAAGDDFPVAALQLCVVPPTVAADTTDREPRYYESGYATRPRDQWYVEPAKVFDDLYFVGDRDQSAWALVTSDGIILFDSNYHFRLNDVVIAGMRKLGLDPARVRYVLISHGHGDHLEGAKTFQSQYGARVVMGDSDWDLVARFPKRYAGMTPRRDIAVTDSMAIALGGTTVRMWLTPSHTPGTVSFTFPVRDRGTTLTVAYSGGVGLNFPNNTPEVGIPAFRIYAQSQQRMAEVAARAGASVLLSNHSWVDNALTRIRQLAGRGTGKHPFDIGPEGVQRFFRMTAGCARVAQLRLEQRHAETVVPGLSR